MPSNASSGCAYLLLFALCALPMTDSANAVPATKAWTSDTHGIREMSELTDANLHSRAEGAKHWKSLRRKVII